MIPCTEERLRQTIAALNAHFGYRARSCPAPHGGIPPEVLLEGWWRVRVVRDPKTREVKGVRLVNDQVGPERSQAVERGLAILEDLPWSSEEEGGTGQPLSGLKVRVVWSEDREAHAQEAGARLCDAGAEVKLIRSPSFNISEHIGKLYHRAEAEPQADLVAELLSDLEPLFPVVSENADEEWPPDEHMSIWIATVHTRPRPGTGDGYCDRCGERSAKMRSEDGGRKTCPRCQAERPSRRPPARITAPKGQAR